MSLLWYVYICAMLSAASYSNYILDLLEGGRKLLVFAHHKTVMDAISGCLQDKVFSKYMDFTSINFILWWVEPQRRMVVVVSVCMSFVPISLQWLKTKR